MKIDCMYGHTAVDAPDRCKEAGRAKASGIQFSHSRKSIESQGNTEATIRRRRYILQRIYEQPTHRQILPAGHRMQKTYGENNRKDGIVSQSLFPYNQTGPHHCRS